MLRLDLANTGESFEIYKVKLKDQEAKRLEELGFCEGTVIDVLSKNKQDMIVSVKDTRYSLNGDTTSRIYGTIVEKDKVKPKTKTKKKGCFGCPYGDSCNLYN